MKQDELESERFTKYSGNWLLNINSILFTGCLLYTMITFTMEYIYAYIFFNVIFFGYVAVSANYFLISNNYLRVKNYLWFWKQSTYRLNDIKEINIISAIRSSTSVKIILHENTSISYKAGSLREKDWINFINELERRGVKVHSISL